MRARDAGKATAERIFRERRTRAAVRRIRGDLQRDGIGCRSVRGQFFVGAVVWCASFEGEGRLPECPRGVLEERQTC